MGGIFSRKPKSTLEVLENLDKSIEIAEDYKKTTQLSQKRYVAYLIIFSSLVYFLAVIVGYFYYYPRSAGDVFLRLIPLFLFPFLIFGLKSTGCWWFVLRLEANDQTLDRLRRRRRELLENVKNKEVYNVAKEILEKYDPNLQAERLKMERKAEEEKFKELQLRQRMAAALDSVNTNNLAATPRTGQGLVKNGQPPHTPLHAMTAAAIGSPQLPRPLMPQNRTALDKVVDYFLADGPNNRYALICQVCRNHNGMALLEDFEYLSYNCAYCFAFNPAKKQRKRLSAAESNSAKSSTNAGDTQAQIGPGSSSRVALTTVSAPTDSSTCASSFSQASTSAVAEDGQNSSSGTNLRARRLANGSTSF